jgi:hypothetical protein
MAIESGYFFITDITGYTQFLAHSELDHAKEILDALFESILDNLEPPLIVSNTQGDAIITYAPEHAFLQPRQLLDTMEKTYFNFRRRLNLMELNTTCTCDACINMSALDLKIFIHKGDYLVQEIGRQRDLQGSDVILAHLLMKNSVLEKTGLPGYGLVSEVALSSMGIDGEADGLIAHIENYEHYGDVKLFIYDLRQAWKVEKARSRRVVTAGDAIAQAKTFVPVPPWIAWDYVADVGNKTRFFDMIRITRTDSQGGREGIGTSYHCQHRNGDIYYLYVDFDPPNYLTIEAKAFGLTSLITMRFTAVEGGSNFEILYGLPTPEDPLEEFDLAQVVAFSKEGGDETVARFAQIIAEDIESGLIHPDQFEQTRVQKDSLKRPGVSKGRYGQLINS